MRSAAEGGRARRVPITALFDSAAGVETAVARLVAAGLPRDLIEVVAGPEAVRRFYGGRARPSARDTFRWAGIGGIVGLLVGAGISLALIALPGFQPPGVMAWVQLVGPNVATVSGALVGAVFGLLRRRAPSSWHARLGDGEERIMVAALARGERELEVVARVLAEAGGRDVWRET
ncbi:MAG: hypothetical protein AB7T31_04575 [Gemmatimonadales bacterium]